MSADERMKRVLGLYMEAVDVVQPSVPGFGDDRQRPPVALHVGMAVFYLPCDYGVADHADAVRIRDHHWAVEKAGIFYPGCARHLAVAIFSKPGGENGIFGFFSA